MTTAECKDKLKTIQLQALRTAGQYLMAEVKPYIPIDTGRLRNTLRLEDDGESVMMVTGDSDTPYAMDQYQTPEEEPLRHNVENGLPIQMMQLLPAGTETGLIHESRYNIAYEHAKKNNLLTKLKTEWYKRLLADSEVMRKAASMFANYFKAAR